MTLKARRPRTVLRTYPYWFYLPALLVFVVFFVVPTALAFFIPKTSKNIDAAKDFLAFVASTAGADALTAKVKPAGPYLIKGAKLPSDVLPFVKDLNGYIDSGNAYPALEFLSPVKGPNLEQICVAVGTGQMKPADAAAAYDKDVEKAAKQLNLPGW